MKFILSSLLVLISYHIALAQDFAFGVNYGSYDMREQRQLQEDFISDVEDIVPLEIVDQFPNFIGFEGQLVQTVRDINMGWFVGFNSTGGRLYYEDYSGKFAVDQLLRSYTAGSVLEYLAQNKREPSKVHFLVSMRTGLSLNRCKLTSDFVMNQPPSRRFESEKFIAPNLSFTPGTGVRINVGRFFIQSEVRFLIDLAGAMRPDSDYRYHVRTKNGEVLTANWSGWRIALLVGFWR